MGFHIFYLLVSWENVQRKPLEKSDLLFRFRLGHGFFLTYLQHCEKIKNNLQKLRDRKKTYFCLPSFNGFQYVVRLHGSHAKNYFAGQSNQIWWKWLKSDISYVLVPFHIGFVWAAFLPSASYQSSQCAAKYLELVSGL